MTEYEKRQMAAGYPGTPRREQSEDSLLPKLTDTQIDQLIEFHPRFVEEQARKDSLSDVTLDDYDTAMGNARAALSMLYGFTMTSTQRKLLTRVVEQYLALAIAAEREETPETKAEEA